MVRFLAFLLLLLPSLQQQPLPEYGSISDLKGLQKVYVIAESTERRNAIVKELAKDPSLQVVGSADEAQFYIEHKIVDDRTPRFALAKVYSAELTVYTTPKENHRRIAWSQTKKQQWKLDDASLARDFVKALKKAN